MNGDIGKTQITKRKKRFIVAIYMKDIYYSSPIVQRSCALYPKYFVYVYNKLPECEDMLRQSLH